MLSLDDRAALAGRLAANPLDVEAIREADDHGETGGLIRLPQRHWARLRCLADDLDRDARLDRPGVPPKERLALLDVRDQLRAALEWVKALALGHAPPSEPGTFPTVEELNAAQKELDDHPVRVAPVAIVAFRQRQILPMPREDAFKGPVHEYQVANAGIHAVWVLLDGMSKRKGVHASVFDQLSKWKRLLVPIQSEVEAAVTERCGKSTEKPEAPAKAKGKKGGKK